jgi:hypothetical protein
MAKIPLWGCKMNPRELILHCALEGMYLPETVANKIYRWLLHRSSEKSYFSYKVLINRLGGVLLIIDWGNAEAFTWQQNFDLSLKDNVKIHKYIKEVAKVAKYKLTAQMKIEPITLNGYTPAELENNNEEVKELQRKCF